MEIPEFTANLVAAYQDTLMPRPQRSIAHIIDEDEIEILSQPLRKPNQPNLSNDNTNPQCPNESAPLQSITPAPSFDNEINNNMPVKPTTLDNADAAANNDTQNSPKTSTASATTTNTPVLEVIAPVEGTIIQKKKANPPWVESQEQRHQQENK